MTALEEIKKALEELREDMGVAYDKGDSRISNILVWCDALNAISPTLESLQLENEDLRKGRDHIAAEKAGIAKNAHSNVDYWMSQYEAAEAEVKRLREGIQWCLSRDERNGSLPAAYATKLQALASTGGEHHGN